ncbi:YfhO family protein [Thermorudis peleae]|uniref:YfhO family protein n=1 Tax=Thermorudis peleae TaxID=1382356 RepID=UPI00056DE66C|nr:YfhO family protein [Thermorudis peleae]
MALASIAQASPLLSRWFLASITAFWLLVIVGCWLRGGRWRAVATELATLGLLGIFHVLFFWRLLLTPAFVPNGGGDLASFTFPLHAYNARVVQSGEFPLWNPTLFSGMPQLANYQAGLLYPLNWVAYLIARPFTYQAVETLVFVHYFIVSLGGYTVARLSLHLRRIAALGAGIGCAFSGFFVAHLGHYSMIAACAWIPWIWLGLERLTVRSQWYWAVLTALAVALLGTAGHQQSVLYGLLASAAWWLAVLCATHWMDLGTAWQALQREPIPWLQLWQAVRPVLISTLRIAFTIACGLALAAPAVLPSLELARRSVRAGGLSYDDASAFSFEPVMLAHFLLPHIFGSNPTNYWGPFSTTETWGYPGIIALAFAALGLILSRHWQRWFFAALGAIALLHALGPSSALHGWVYRFVPFDNLLRAPARTLLYVDFAVAFLAALGLDALLCPLCSWDAVRVILRRGIFILVGGIIFILGIALPVLYNTLLSRDIPPRILIAIDDLNVLLLLLGLLAALFWAWYRQILTSSLLGLVSLGLLFFDLATAQAGFNPTSNDILSGYRHPEVVSFLRQHGAASGQFRIESAAAPLQPSAAAVFGFEDASGLFDPMQPAAYARVLDTLRNHRDWPAYDLLNVRYLITRADVIPPSTRFHRVLTTTDGLAIWEDTTALPRAWLSSQAEVVPVDHALDRVLTATFDPRTKLYLSGPALPAADPNAQGTISLAQDGPNRIHLTVTTSAPVYLVLAVTADPGWHATIDGQAAPIALADGIYQALWLPAGQHTVTFAYWPPLLTAGLITAAAGTLGLLAFAFLPRLTRQRTHRTPRRALAPVTRSPQ